MPSDAARRAVASFSLAAVAAVALSSTHAHRARAERSLDEIVARQSAGMESTFFGTSILGDRYGHSVMVHPAFGLYEAEGVLSGLGVSWYTSRLLPWEAGIGGGKLDFDLTTWTLALSSGQPVWSSTHGRVLLEGALGYQFLDKKSGHEILINVEDPSTPYGISVRLDSFEFLHAMVHAVCTFDVGFLRPLIEVGLVGTAYRFDGHVDETLVTSAGEREGDGFAAKPTFGTGAALQVDHGILFGGFRAVRGGILFQADVGLAF